MSTKSVSKPRTRAEARKDEVLAWLQQDRPVTVFPMKGGYAETHHLNAQLARYVMGAAVEKNRPLLSSEDTLLLP